MNIVNIEYDFTLHFEENCVNVLYMENPNMFANCIHNLWRQLSGSEGSWILSDADKTLNIVKEMVCVSNPFSVDCNDKRVLNHLYRDMEDVAKEQYAEEYISVNSNAVAFIDRLIEAQPYTMDMKVDLDLMGLLKLYDVKFETTDVSLLEKLITYLKIMHQVCRVEIFVFFHLKSYLREDELLQLYQAAGYEKVFLWLLESHYEKKLAFEKVKLVDQDLCVIDL